MYGISLDERGGNRVTVNGEFASVAEFLTEFVTDVSSEGVFIRTDTPLPEGKELNLKFTIIGNDIEIIEGEGTVVRSIPAGNGAQAGMGVEFKRLTRESRQAIERVVEARKRLS